MSFRFAYLCVVSIFLLCFVTSCANQLPLTGGPKDETPPQIDTAASLKNYQIRFLKQDINLFFDEYVDLRDASTQILISPPLSFAPVISSKLKKINITFNEEEELKEEATYVINFGKSIRDFTEGNELVNYSFVFSTGDYIDSLSMQGTITDAKSGQPRKDVLVLLYADSRDSVVYQDRPFYFARTDENGAYKINNLRADTFKVAVMSDEDLSYTYNPGSEEIGFLDSLVILRDTLTSGINLEIFKEATEPRYKSYDVIAKGKSKLEFEGRVSAEALVILDSVDHYIYYEKDDPFLMLWYRPSERKSLRYEVKRGEQLDTVQLRINTRTTDTLEGRIDITKLNADAKVGLHPQLPLEVSFDRPIDQANLQRIFLVDTLTNDTLNFGLDSIVKFPSMRLSINCSWPVERALSLTFYPGAITDFFGRTNDTISENFYIASDVDFGRINLTPVDFDSVDHVIQLMKDDKVVAQKIYHFGEEEVFFERLLPGTYSVQIIVDEVPNGFWDPGNYLEKRQSERIYKVPLGELRANWEMMEELEMSRIRGSNEDSALDSDSEETPKRK